MSVRALVLGLFTLLKVGLPALAGTGLALPPQGIVQTTPTEKQQPLLVWNVAETENLGDEFHPDLDDEGVAALLAVLPSYFQFFFGEKIVSSSLSGHELPICEPGRLFLRFRNLRL